MEFLNEETETRRIVNVVAEMDRKEPANTDEILELFQKARTAPGVVWVRLHVPCDCVDAQGKRCGLYSPVVNQRGQHWEQRYEIGVV